MSLLATRGLAGSRSLGNGRRAIGSPSRPLKLQTLKGLEVRKTGRFLASTFASQHITALNRLQSTVYRYPTRVFSTEATEAPVEVVEALPEKSRIPRLPLLITAISVVPYLACSVIPFAFPFEIAGKALFMQMTYGAVSLSMLGTIHWGLAMSEYKRVDGAVDSAVSAVPSASDQALRYIGGVLPGLAAWMFMTQEPLIGMLGLMSGVAAMGLFELGAHRARLLPSWYVRLRVPWTISVLLCLGINLIHLL